LGLGLGPTPTPTPTPNIHTLIKIILKKLDILKFYLKQKII